MSRYTTKSLEHDVLTMNDTLADAGSDIHFEVSPRNGSCAIDQCETGNYRNLEVGSPRECYQAANRVVIRECQRIEMQRLKPHGTPEERLAQAATLYAEAIAGAATDLLRKQVTPFCEKHGLEFLSGNGTFAFFRDGDPIYIDDDEPVEGLKEILAEMERTVLSEAGGHELGQYVSNYRTP